MGHTWTAAPPTRAPESLWLLLGLLLMAVGLIVAALVGQHQQCSRLTAQHQTAATVAHGCDR